MAPNVQANWEKILTDHQITKDVQDALAQMGYHTSAAFSFDSEDTFQKFMKFALIQKKLVPGVTEDDWTFHPLVGTLRAVWLACAPSHSCIAVPQPPAALPLPQAAASALLQSASSKLSVLDRDKLRRELESKFPSVYITPASLPSLGLLQCVQNQASSKAWEWVPWKRLLSDKAAAEVQARRSRTPHNEVLEFLCVSAGLHELEWDQDLPASPYKLQLILQTRAHVYAMVNACHLGNFNLYTAKFLDFYTSAPGEGFRPPSAAEAEEADKTALNEIFSLCFGGASLDDAISTIINDRDLLRYLLMARPKPVSQQPTKLARPKRPATRVDDARKKPRTGECHLWMDGKCKRTDCKWKHACATCGSTKHNSTQCRKVE